MRVDRYTRVVLTVIAGALVYICIALTPMPSVSAQRALRPGDDTGPGRVVVVGWEATAHLPVQVVDSITLKTTGDMRVVGPVQTQQSTNSTDRVVLTGWEDRDSSGRPRLRSFDPGPVGLPVRTVGDGRY